MVFDKWRKALKKKDVKLFNVLPPVTKPVFSSDVFTFSEPPINKTTHTHVQEWWKINFPKIAEDLIEPGEFRKNVGRAVSLFMRINFPLDINLPAGVVFSASSMSVNESGYNVYPVVMLQPTITGPYVRVQEFLKPFKTWSGFELYWKGSFLKNKTTGKISGMRLTDLAYNIPDKMVGGQPASYTEHTLL